MAFKNNILVLCACGIIMLFFIAGMPLPASAIKWLILKECMVRVNGTTNINKFACTVAGYSNSDTVTCSTGKTSSGSIDMSGDVALHVFNFDCVNTMMTKDLRKTLKEKEYPLFFIHFISMERYPRLKPSAECITGLVSIELAGVKKLFTINYTISMDEKGIIGLSGMQTIHFSDFNLMAPRKLGGMIKTSDKLEVEFLVHCRIIK
ncbi:MAG: YceI family protein [Bacteroidota bacterium]